MPAPSTSPLRIVAIGLVHGHVEGLLDSARRRDDLELVGIWEPDVALFARLASKYDLDQELHATDLESMLARSRPEAASIMTSVHDHLYAIRVCAQHGVHALVEKPLAFTTADAHGMSDLAQQHNIMVLTNYETSWYASLREAKRVLDSGRIGAIRRMIFRHGHRGPREVGCYQEFLDWLTHPEGNGAGALVDFGCYGAAIATWLMGGQQPTDIVASSTTTKPDLYPDVDDDATIILTYPGATATIQASWAWTHDNKEMDIHAESGSLHAGKWDRLTTRKPDQSPRSRRPRPMEPHLADEWTYLRHVVRGECDVDQLSSLELNITVATILDTARRLAST